MRDSLANCSWDKFNEMLEKNPRGNFGNIGSFTFANVLFYSP